MPDDGDSIEQHKCPQGAQELREKTEIASSYKGVERIPITKGVQDMCVGTWVSIAAISLFHTRITCDQNYF